MFLRMGLVSLKPLENMEDPVGGPVGPGSAWGGLADLAPDQPVTVEVTAPDGAVWAFEAHHTLSDEQIEWFRAGSALNIIRSRAGRQA